MRQVRLWSCVLGLVLGTTQASLANRQSDTFITIDCPGAADLTEAWGINPCGEIVGNCKSDGVTHGFLLSGDRFTTIDVSGATSTRAFGVNPHGEIVGDYTLDGTLHGFLLTRDGAVTTIDVPEPPRHRQAGSTIAATS